MCTYRNKMNNNRIGMKATDKQKELCEFIRSQSSYWANSNDIDSPTHYSDIDEEINNIEWLNDYSKIGLMHLMEELYFFIKKHGRE